MDLGLKPQPTFYMFKCEQSSPPGVPKPCCVTKDSKGLFNYMASVLMEKGIMGPVQAIKTSCLGRCEVGPLMLVEPGHYMYVQLSKEKIDKIVEEHIIGGNPIKEYLIADELWSDPLNLSKS